MKLEQQVCSLELAKKLKEFGVKQESQFYWAEFCGHEENWVLISTERFDSDHLIVEDYSSAFTVAELGELLPPAIASAHGKDMTWICFNEMKRSRDEVYLKHGDTEADARARMMIYLLENKLITPEA